MTEAPPYTLYVASHERFEPTRAGLVLRAAIAARKAGGGARIALLGAAIALMRPSIARKKVAITLPASGRASRAGLTRESRTLQSLIDEARELGVVCYT